MPENIILSLNELISKTNSDGKNRRSVGYSISSYSNVLSALEKAKIISDGNNNEVMGVRRPDFTGVSNMTYDDSGFSNDKKSGIWKMALTFHGAAPLKQTSEAWYEIVKFEGDSIERAVKMDSDKTECPYFLSQQYLDMTTVEDFMAGAYIDLQNLGVKYFNTFYANGGTYYNEHIVSQLVYGGYVVAQIIFPQKNTYKLVKILGKTSISKCATVSLTSSLLACNGWEDLGISIRVKQNGTNPVIFMPNGTDYMHPCQGETYYYSSGKIGNYNKSNFKNKWLNYPMSSLATSPKVLEMELPNMGECFVRLFIPKEFRDEAIKIIGNPPNEYIFQEYIGKLEYMRSNSVEYTGNITSIMAGVTNKWATVGQTVSFGSLTNKISYSMQNRPSVLLRGCGTTFISASESQPFMPKFGHPNNINVYDCSSFVSLVLWDSGIVREDVTSVPAFGTDDLCSPSIVGKINRYLKDNYEAKFIELTDENEVQKGDILCITKSERLKFHNHDYNGGHAVIACPEGDVHYTIEIGSNKNAEGTKKKGYAYNYYKHIIRIVEK